MAKKEYFEYVERLQRVEVYGSIAPRYYYIFRGYETEKDILGVDFSFRELTKTQFEKVKKQKEFKITYRRNSNNKSIDRVRSKTEYTRKFKRMSNRVKFDNIIKPKTILNSIKPV